MKQEPRALLSDADPPMNLVRTDTVLAIGNHPDGAEPLVQPQRGILENRPGLERELSARMMASALPTTVLGLELRIRAPACRTDHSFRPATRHEILVATVRVGEVDDGFL